MRTKLLFHFVIIFLGFSNYLIAQCNSAGEEINFKNEQFLIGLASMPNAVIGSDGKLNIKSYPFTDRDWKGWRFELRDGNSYVEIVNNPVFLYNDGTSIKVGNNNSNETKRFREITYPLTSRVANNESVFFIKYINGFKTVQLSHTTDVDKVLGIKKSDLRNGTQFEWVSSKSKDYLTEFTLYKRPDYITSINDLDGHDNSYHFEFLSGNCNNIGFVGGVDPFAGEERKYWQIKNINDSLYTISAFKKILSASSGTLKLIDETQINADCIWRIYPTGDGTEFLIQSFNSNGFLTWSRSGQTTYELKPTDNHGWRLRKKYLCCQDHKIFVSGYVQNSFRRFVEGKVYASILNDKARIEEKISEFNNAVLDEYNNRLKASDALFEESVKGIIQPGKAYYITVFDPNRLDGKIQWEETLVRYFRDWNRDHVLLYFDSYYSFRIYGLDAIYAKEKYFKALSWKDFFKRNDANLKFYVGCYKPFAQEGQGAGYNVNVKAVKCEDYDPIRKLFKVRFSDGTLNDVSDNGHFTTNNRNLNLNKDQIELLRFQSNGITSVDSTVITGPYNDRRTKTFNACKLIFPPNGSGLSEVQDDMLDFSRIYLYVNKDVETMNQVKQRMYPDKNGLLGLLDFVGTNGKRYLLVETTFVE